MATPRQYKFTERGIPTLAEKWSGQIPPLREYPPTPSGRRARGQLDNMLDYICKCWLMGGTLQDVPDLCTAEWLARAVTDIDGKPTSTGAIARTLHRWKALGYAIVEESPMRFVSLTEQGMRIGIEELERKAKKKSKHYNWDAPRKGKGG